MPASVDELFDVLDDFLMRLMNFAEIDGMEALIELDLSFSQVRLLFLLATSTEPVSIHTIAAGLGLSDAAAGRNVEQMLHLDLVERRESPADRRVKLVTLSPKGQESVTAHITAKRESVKGFAAELTPEQRENLYRAITDVLTRCPGTPHTNQENPS